MKRKRGRKGKSKKPQLTGTVDVPSDVVISNVEENSGVDELENDDVDSGAEAATPSSAGTDQPEKAATPSSAGTNQPEKAATPSSAGNDQPEKAATPSSTGTDQPEKAASVSSGGRMDTPAVKAVYRRVKVRIKTSKALESQPTSSEAHTHSDTDKSNLQVGLEKQGVGEKIEDSANSLSENTLLSISENPVKKFGGIRIKSSKGLSSSTISPCTNNELVNEESKVEKNSNDTNSRYNKRELDTALEVIKKVMKMDAAEPFNTPVNPIALGIPDYFDVIDTPMDFGTICSNLEKGKYMNADDVFEDVKYIWNNCYKYNNKGDYIVELMKRVKKNFIKCWIDAGLYDDHIQGVENNQMKDTTPSSNEMMSDKGGSSSQMIKKRHGLKKHKDGCLCAICVMMRRRQEREEIARLMEDPMEISDDDLDEGGKQQGMSPFQSPGGEYASSNMDNSPDLEANSDHGEKRREIKWEDAGNHHTPPLEKRHENENGGGTSEHSQLAHRPGEELSRDETKLQKPKVKLDKRQKAKIYENLRYLENPMLLDLCGTIFGDGHKSVWNGPHSLVRKEGSGSTRRKSSIHSAISTFMK